jgi:hypothetical protein
MTVSGALPPTMGRPPARGVEWEFQRLTFDRDSSRSMVAQLLVERAEHGGWELDRVRVSADGIRRVVLRRRIIRMRPTVVRPLVQPPA